MSTGAESDALDGATERIRERGEEIRRRELQTALHRLEAGGELTDAQRAAAEALARRLVDRLLAVPERRLAAAGDDEEAVQTALELFASA